MKTSHRPPSHPSFRTGSLSAALRPSQKRPRRRMVQGLYYNRAFISRTEREEILSWLSSIYPIWEDRFSKFKPLPEGEEQRRLLRPVYWLGNWQFACLNYYHPPHGIHNRCVQAEPFPPVLARLVEKIEAMTRKMYRGADLPEGWHLNTCLVNFYGDLIRDGKRCDAARVGEHKDFEPGPVASLSLGERAIFQFVESDKPGSRNRVIEQQWLDDGSLQIFGGRRWKKDTFHRVQRVDRKEGHRFPIHLNDFQPRRINFTFRFVPDEHVKPFRELPPEAQQDVREYMEALAAHSEFFAREL